MAKLISAIKTHKWKIVFSFIAFLFSILFLFPYNDIGDKASSLVSDLTQGQIYLEFQNMGLDLIPQPGLKFQDVAVETPFFDSLKADAISISPSISGLLSFKPGVFVEADGLFGGSVSISTRGGDKTKAGVLKQEISIDAKKVNLKDVIQFVKVPADAQGQIQLDLEITVDPTFAEQPSADISAQTAKLKIANLVIPTDLGPYPLPALEFSQIVLSGELKNGTLKFNNAKLGNAGDELAGSLKGQMDVKFIPQGPVVQPVLSAYDLSIEFQTLPSFEQKLGAAWSILEQQLESYKRPAAGSGKGYAFRISSPSLRSPPKFSPYQ